MKRLAALGVVVACTYHNPKPQYAQPGPPQQPLGQQQPPQPAVASQPAPPAPVQPAPPPEPAKPPEEPGPIDPNAEMPKDSITTNTKLVLGTEATIKLDARSDIYSATAKKADPGRGGVLPSEVTLAKEGGIISFPKVIGRAACVADAGATADGGDCAGGSTDLTSAGKLSGIKHGQRTMFLVGVFVGAKLPAKAPAVLDFSDDKLGTKFPKLEPVLGQVFWIGDGKPGEPAGDTHDFVIPKGATRLYLGYADGYGFQGTPGAYGDNKGGLAVTILQRK
ncbi:MAG TPA: hypothetical protein VFV99_22005 [Kofleriaceae bacterium]|nr:hypothetical protein [Kofleriaceae bacterium]